MYMILELEHIQKYYGNKGNLTKAIKDISFSVEAGEFLSIMGASGSGKTTLLNCISTIDTVSAGHIYLDGTDITEIKPKSLARFRRENLGFVFQDFNLLDTLTISENIALALTINRMPAGMIEKAVLEMAEQLNICDILDKYPYQVSGGQKQRCACTRAMIHKPKLLLADEPTGALDSHSAQMLLSTIQGIHRQIGTTILMVTHDAFTASYAERILFLQDGEIFMELYKGSDSRSAFFQKILNVLTMMGGGKSHVCETGFSKC
ncbi:MAG: ABC transporter ATP-binding protein [Lachnospiraceae bacterium]|nr:ABC transporter ATP-binding protein [Lachnospiraceae bacterium]